MPAKTKSVIIYAIVGAGAILLVMIDPFLLIRACASASYNGGMEPAATSINYTVPIDVVIVNTETNRVSYSESDIQTILYNANQYWQQANVTFIMRTIDKKEVPDELLRNLHSTDDSGIKELGRTVLGDKFEDGIIDVIIFKSFADGKQDIAPVEGKIAAAFLTELDNMDHISYTLAHELGHTVGLCDVFEVNLMMKTETPLRMAIRTAYLPSDLTDDQIAVVRHTIEARYV